MEIDAVSFPHAPFCVIPRATSLVVEVINKADVCKRPRWHV